MRKRIRFSRAASAQIERASMWWRRNRGKAPDAFDEDLYDALNRLRSSPSIGTPIRARRLGVRSLWLERIGYFVYYHVLDDVIEVIAIWHASRGTRPRL